MHLGDALPDEVGENGNDATERSQLLRRPSYARRASMAVELTRGVFATLTESTLQLFRR